MEKSKLSLKEKSKSLFRAKRLFEDKKRGIAEFIKFCLVGGSGMVVDLFFVFISMQVLSNLAVASPLFRFRIARASGFFFALTSNFLLNRTFTFAKAARGNIYRQYTSYFIVAFSAFIVNWSTSVYLYEKTVFFNKHYLVAAFMGVIAGTMINFTGSKLIVFNNKVLLRTEKALLKFFRDNSVLIALSALIGMVADYFLSNWFLSAGFPPGLSLFLSFFPSSLIVLSWWGLKWIKSRGNIRIGPLIFISIMALFLRGGIYDNAIRIGLSLQASIISVVISNVIHIYIGIAVIQWIRNNPELRWRAMALAVAGYMLVLRLYYIGSVELLPQEAYYWLYARHLDIGYLDHPPMVAWLIWANSLVLGYSEFSIRFGAFLSWMASAAFCFGLTRNLFGKTAAWVSVCLFSVLPFFFAVGFVMTPDAPLTACWAGTLYFLERALIGKKRTAWWGAGVCVGLGMLSKYTIALLLPSALLFMLVDRESRGWLLRPEPYAATLVSAFLFLPVIIWNVQHDWASFIFQGPRRLQGELAFNLPQLLGSVILLLTPIGAAAVFPMFRKLRVKLLSDQRDRFSLVFLLFPFLVFFLFSFFRDVKLNWTGPLWIIALPAMAGQIISFYESAPGGIDLFLKRAWVPTVVVCVLVWGGILHFLALGAPGMSYVKSNNIGYIAGWSNLAVQIEKIEDDIEEKTGVEPIVIGMDKNKISSELAYYRNKITPGDEGFLYTTGRHIFGMDSLMFQHWAEHHSNAVKKKGQTLILVSREPSDFHDANIHSSGWVIGSINELTVEKEKGFPLGKYFYTVATVRFD